MQSYKKFLNNIGILTIGNFGSKILTFLMIPLYTKVLSTSEYGTFDLMMTTINLLIPFLVQNIYDSILRFSFDHEIKSVMGVGIKYNLLGLLGFFFITLLNLFFNFIPSFNDYIICFVLLYITLVLYTNLSSFLRGIDEIKVLSIMGVINTFVIMLFNLIFLLIFRFGLNGYFFSYIFAYLISIIYASLKVKIWKYFSLKIDKKIELEMLSYSRPLILNTISWWINNTSDRYIVTLLCGFAENGIYSVAYKIPSLLTVFQNIFLQAWQISAIEEYDNKNKEYFFSNVYTVYNAIMVILASFIIALTKLIANIFYSNDFYNAWKYVPFLMISVVFGAMSGYVGGIFSAAKDSKMFGTSTLVGAIINFILNIILVYIVGTVGAAIATCISYAIIWQMRMKQIHKYIVLKINLKRDIFNYFVLIVQSILMLFIENNNLYTLQIVCITVILSTYYNEVKKLKAELEK